MASLTSGGGELSFNGIAISSIRVSFCDIELIFCDDTFGSFSPICLLLFCGATIMLCVVGNAVDCGGDGGCVGILYKSE